MSIISQLRSFVVRVPEWAGRLTARHRWVRLLPSVTAAMTKAAGGRDALAGVIREYFKVCDRMNDFILLIYQESQSLLGEGLTGIRRCNKDQRGDQADEQQSDHRGEPRVAQCLGCRKNVEHTA